MKKLVLILLIACVGFIGCQAKEAEAGDWNPCESKLSGIFNDCADADDAKSEIGVGVDTKLWVHEKFTIDQESRLNLNGYGTIADAGNYSTYTVFKPKMDKGVLQIVGDFFAGLFD
jgi:hypothetical protein